MQIRAALVVAGVLLSPLLSVTCEAQTRRTKDHTKFTPIDFAKLRFLEGRWSGKAPDGSAFYEEYDFPDALTLRSRHHADATFSKVTDRSTVALRDGRVTSTWGEFSWEASEIREGAATFRPVNAPSSFTWRRLSEDAVEVKQNWKDEAGALQTYSLTLIRVR